MTAARICLYLSYLNDAHRRILTISTSTEWRSSPGGRNGMKRIKLFIRLCHSPPHVPNLCSIFFVRDYQIPESKGKRRLRFSNSALESEEKIFVSCQ